MKNFIFQDILFEHKTISSTNEEAKKMVKLKDGGKCFAVLSHTQTNGKGRLGREWNSSFEGNIYLTIGVHFSLCQNFADILPLYTAFILLKSIGEKAHYKWVNDVIIEGKKVAGILIEKVDDFFIIGIGVNVVNHPLNAIFPACNLSEFNLDLKPVTIFENFQNHLELRREFVINYLQNRFFTQDEIKINQGEFIGKFHKIIENGNLILKQRNGSLKEISFGDVGV